MGISHAEYCAMLTRLAITRPSSRPEAPAKGVDREAPLHDDISAECRRRGWIAIHSRMDRQSHIMVGCPDFLILRDNGNLLLVEAKTRTGKLRPEQQAFAVWAEKLGHKVHVVRSMEEFLRL